MYRNKKITFLHISKYNIKRKLFPFIKSVLISFTLLKKNTQNLEEFSLKNYSSPNIISYTTFLIYYLSRDINLTFLTIFYIVFSNSN